MTHPIVSPVSTHNPGLPLRIGTFDSLVDGLDYAARGETGLTFFSGRGEAQDRLTYRDLQAEARELAARLVGAGLERGSRFALIAETSPAFMLWFFACQYAGLLPVPLPLSVNLGSHDAYVRRLRGMLNSAGPVAAMAPADLLPVLREAAIGTEVTHLGTAEDFRGLPIAGGAPRPFGADDPSYIQYSSGSTTEPRGVLITQRAITANARAIARDGLKVRAGDRAASWLPLYHDMGLVGFCITPMLAQVSVDYLATATFAVRPRTWLKVISEQGGTVSYSPTFGYELCVRRAGRDGGGGFRLQQWRVAGIGGEMVRPNVLTDFARMFAASGFDERAFVPSYGLAEATLAVSFAPLETGARVDTIDREQYERFNRASVSAEVEAQEGHRARSFVACGEPLPGYSIEIRDDEDHPVPERSIGRVFVNGPSLMTGYYGRPDMTRRVLGDDGWLDTGDMGYRVDDSLVITGRRKDLIICNGRNIWPQDLEWALEQVDGVKTGSVAAFSISEDDAERVVLVVECYANDLAPRQALVHDLTAIIQRTAGVHCEVTLVSPRTLPYTSSGKLSRAAAKQQYLSGALTPLPTVRGEAVADALTGG